MWIRTSLLAFILCTLFIMHKNKQIRNKLILLKIQEFFFMKEDYELLTLPSYRRNAIMLQINEKSEYGHSTIQSNSLEQM